MGTVNRWGRSAAVGAFLVGALREGAPVPSPGRAGPAEIAAAADLHKVASLLHRRLRAVPGIDASLTDLLAAAHTEQVKRQLATQVDLARLAPLLTETAGEWLVLKGPALAAVGYADPAARTYADLDLVVPRPRVPAVLAALESAGAVLVGDPWPALLATDRAQLTLKLPHGTPLDLHWHLFNNPRVRRAFAVDMAALTVRRRPVSVGGVAAHTLHPADMLVHVAAHAALSGGFRLKWVKDVDMLARYDVADWDDVVVTARRGRLGLPVAVMLGRARHLLGTPLPPGLLDRLAPPSGWRAVAAGLDRFLSPAEATRAVATGNVVVAATRATTGGSAAQLGRSLRTSVLVPVLRSREHPWRGGPAAPAGPVTVVPDDPARAVFLARLGES